MKQATVQDVVRLMESFAPKSYAMEGDKIGLQIGSSGRRVKRVLAALDVLEHVVDEAIEKDAQMIVAHHPVIYRPLSAIDLDGRYGKMIEKLIKHDIAVYAAHTNLDVAPGGVNDMLCERLQLRDAEPLVPTKEIPLKKLVCFVPKDHLQPVIYALGKAGAGAIGNYSYCSFAAEGIGRFLPGENTNPFIGQPGKLEEVEEVRLETIFPETIEKQVIARMLESHPYEEPAYDIYPLENEGMKLGLGRIGIAHEEMGLDEYAEFVKKALRAKAVRVVGNPGHRVRKVAVLGGDGNKFFSYAKEKGADVYITGDVYYHTAHDALMAGLNIIDPGHHMEHVMKEQTAEKLNRLFREAGLDAEALPSEPPTDPFRFV